MTPFNKPYFSGHEAAYMLDAVRHGHISGDGIFTRRCQAFFEQQFGFRKALLTTSCTDALEMASLLLNIKPGDEVIVPSFTFVSTANAFVLRGATLVFADSTAHGPNLDVAHVAELVTARTRAVVPVHYAGVACDMDPLLHLAGRHGFAVVEDAAQAIGCQYRGQNLGTLGALATFSFHETKNISSGEGGLLALNDAALVARAEIIREKGTNRSAFFRGEVDKYNWVDVGSSFLPSDLIAAFLWAQLENLEGIQARRLAIWQRYNTGLAFLETVGVGLPAPPAFATHNGHLYYLVCRSLAERTALIDFLRRRSIMAVFHYQALHGSPFARAHLAAPPPVLPWAERYSDCLVRLPIYHELAEEEQQRIIETVNDFYAQAT